MTFVQPALLWGALAIAIPIAIHFWHQKQGKPLPWAATFWLTERDQQPNRGLRLDNVLLLIVRCLLLIVLAILLSQPLLDWWKKPQTVQRVHVVQPNAFVADNFRFELDEARKKGEKVHWAEENLEPFDDDNKPKRSQRPFRFNALTLQSAINQISSENTELHIYVANDPALAEVPAITVPAGFRLHTVVDSASRPRAFLTGKSSRKLFVNRAGLLTSSAVLEPTIRFQDAPAHSGPLRVLLAYQTQLEQQTVRAALNALTETYGLELMIDEKNTIQPYDWVLTDGLPNAMSPQTLYVVSGVERTQSTPNIVFTNERLTPQTSERVGNGQLPEWLGRQLIRHYNLQAAVRPLGKQELNALFLTSKPRDTGQQAGIQNVLLLVFVVVLLIERWLALTKNA